MSRLDMLAACAQLGTAFGGMHALFTTEACQRIVDTTSGLSAHVNVWKALRLQHDLTHDMRCAVPRYNLVILSVPGWGLTGFQCAADGE